MPVSPPARVPRGLLVLALATALLSLAASASAAPPGAPLNSRAASGPQPGQITVSWDAPATNGGSAITAWKVYRSTQPNQETFLTQVAENNQQPVRSFVDSGIPTGETRYYKITAVNADGESALSEEAIGTAPVKPGQPRNPAASPGPEKSQITIRWEAPVSSGGTAVTNYKIYRGSASGQLTYLWTVDNVLSYRDSGLADGSTWYYTATAVNGVGEGPSSSEVVATAPMPPAAPTSLTTSPGPGVGQIKLQWQAPSSNGGIAVTNYKIYRGTSSGQVTFLTQVDNVLTYTDSGFSNGDTRYYQVSAVNGVGEGARSTEAIGTAPTPPTSPRNPSSSAGPNVGQITIRWEAPQSTGGLAVTNYKVYRGSAAGQETLLTTVDNVLQYVDSGLGNGDARHYRVSAVNAAGEGAQTLSFQGTSPSPPGAPTQPSASSGPQPGENTIRWQAPATTGGMQITGYKVYGGSTSGQLSLLATLGNVLQHTDRDLGNGVRRYYHVKALNAVGEGAASTEVFATTPTSPSPPRNLAASRGPGGGEITLTWQAPESNGGLTVTGYKVYRGTSSGQLTLLTTLGDVTTFKDTGLANGVTRFYHVRALNAAAEGDASNEVSATAPVPPSLPQELAASRGPNAGQITLSWKAPASTGGIPVTGYKVYRGESSGQVALLASVGNVLTYADNNLPNGVTRYYQVAAENGAGESARAPEVSGATPVPPGAPTDLTTTPGPQPGQITLRWKAPADNGGTVVTGYKIYRGTTAGQTTLLTQTGAALEFKDANLPEGALRYYRVAALNGAGEGTFSSEIAGTAPRAPDPPRNLTAQPANQVGRIALAWVAPASDGGLPVQHYRVYRGTTPGQEAFLAQVASGLSFTDANIPTGESRYYTIRAVSAVGESASHASVQGSPPGPPDAPIKLVATAGPGPNDLTIRWEPPAQRPILQITKYRVYAGNGPGEETFLVDVGTSQQHVERNLAPGTERSYRVSAVNAAGESAKSASVVARGHNAPPAPTNVEAKPGSRVGEIKLTWAPPTVPGKLPITGYRVYAGNTSGNLALLRETSMLQSLTETGLAQGQTRYYQVTALNAAGESPRTNETRGRAPDVPRAPMQVVAKSGPGEGQIMVTWKPPADDGGLPIASYRVYRASPTEPERFVARVETWQSFVDSDLPQGTVKSYRVAGVNDVGEGEKSSVATGRAPDPPGAPRNVSAAALPGRARVELQWETPDEYGFPILEYRVFRRQPSGNLTLVSTVPGPATKATDRVSSDGQFGYVITATNALGEGPPSTEARANVHRAPAISLGPLHLSPARQAYLGDELVASLRVVNDGGLAGQAHVHLLINGQPHDAASVDVPADSTVTIRLNGTRLDTPGTFVARAGLNGTTDYVEAQLVVRDAPPPSEEARPGAGDGPAFERIRAPTRDSPAASPVGALVSTLAAAAFVRARRARDR